MFSFKTKLCVNEKVRKIYLFLNLGTSQSKMDLYSNNGTLPYIGSNQTFTCAITPCNGKGDAVMQFGSHSMLFSGRCNTNLTSDERIAFVCNVGNCMYGLHIYGVQIQDHQIPVICTYRFSSGETLTNATYINIIGKLCFTVE